MPTNLYGPNDNFDLESSHVLPALNPAIPRGEGIRGGHRHGLGTGNPRREFLHGDDMAEAACFLMDLSDDVLDGEFFRSPLPSFINIVRERTSPSGNWPP
jgi:nucleoside-diphosphate-sugar epimerase